MQSNSFFVLALSLALLRSRFVCIDEMTIGIKNLFRVRERARNVALNLVVLQTELRVA